MKKYLALILAVLMLVGLFAGCKEDKKPSVDDGNQPGTTPPDQNDPPVTNPPDQNDPPATNPPDQNDPPTPPETPKEKVTMFVWGGMMMGSYYFTETLAEMVAEGTDKEVNLIGSWLSHGTGASTWNAYEIFSGLTVDSSDTGLTISSEEPDIAAGLEEKIDIMVLQAGRDFTLDTTVTSKTKANIAYSAMVKLALAKNPDLQVVIAAPYGHQTSYVDMKDPVVTNHTEHVALIDAGAKELVDYLKEKTAVKNISMVSVGSLFEAYSTDANKIKADLFRPDNGVDGRKNEGNRATKQGAYLAACGVYAAITGKSPVGLKTLGYQKKTVTGAVMTDAAIDQETATAMQTLAAEFTGTAPKKINLFAWGGQMMGSYYFTETLAEMLAEGTGDEINLIGDWLSHGNGVTTWNSYELFSGLTVDSSDTGLTIASGEPKIAKDIEEKIDIMVLQAGRDFTLDNTLTSKTKANIAFSALVKMALAKNPDLQVVIIAPYGHQTSYVDMKDPVVTNHTEHVALIDARAKDVVDYLKEKTAVKNISMISVGSLFEAYSTDAAKIRTDLFRPDNGVEGRKNEGNRSTKEGSYLAACAVYAAITGKSPVGLKTLGYQKKTVTGAVMIDAAIAQDTATAMQTLAAEFTGTAPQKYTILAWGGIMLGSYGFMDTLAEMIQETTDKEVYITGGWLAHGTTSTTFNAYEMFYNLTIETTVDGAQLGTGSSATKFAEAVQGKVDLLILQAGRDFTLDTSGTGSIRANTAYAAMVKMALKNNPDLPVIIVAPYGHQTDYADMKAPTVANHKEHVALIDAEAKVIVDYIKANTDVKDIRLVSVGSLFESYSTDAAKIKADLFRADDGVAGRKNVGNRSTQAGSYLAACAVYATATGNSPVGLKSVGFIKKTVTGAVMTDGSVSQAVATELQQIAANFLAKAN